MAKVKMSEDEMIEKLCESFNLSDKGEAELRAFTYEIKVRAITLAVSKERERIVEMIEKEIDRIKNGDIKWVGLRKALKLIQNERTI